ncbi:MAG: permease-like cell division protein FtsX [Microthrixaceae bacterium]|nr:permease-like cell division protein FtsX [Microthrixaceae bacterium]
MSDHNDPKNGDVSDGLRYGEEPSVNAETGRTELQAQNPPRATRVPRVGLAIIGVAAVVTAVVVTSMWWPSGGQRTVVATDVSLKTTTEPSKSGGQAPCPKQMVVYMKLDSTQADVDGVASVLDSTQGVEKVVFMDDAMTYAEFKDLFAEDPDLVDSVNPADLPVSFRVTVAALWSPEELHRFEALPGVDRVEVMARTVSDFACAVTPDDKSLIGPSGLCSEPERVFVYMALDSTEADVDGVASVLDATDGVEDVVFIDREAAYSEFKEVFFETSDFVDSINPEELPESFRITRSASWSSEDLDRIKALPGVFRVEDGMEIFQALCGTGDTSSKDFDGLPDFGD